MQAVSKIESMPSEFSNEQVELIKQTVCKGVTDDEFKIFLHVCKRTGLDPFVRQIYGITRWDKTLNRNKMTVQCSIDGLRLIADRTGKYSPGKEPSYVYDANGRLMSATSYVKKMTPDKTWHEVGATAIYSEYVQTSKDGRPSQFWAKMGHVMIAKCAEALALRKAFPQEMTGVYIKEEMDQAEQEDLQEEEAEFVDPEMMQENPKPEMMQEKPKPKMISGQQAYDLNEIISRCSPSFKQKVENFLEKAKKKEIGELSLVSYETIYVQALDDEKSYQADMAAIA